MATISILCSLAAIVIVIRYSRHPKVPYLKDPVSGEYILRFNPSRKILALAIGLLLPLGLGLLFAQYVPQMTLKDFLTVEGLMIPFLTVASAVSGIQMYLETEHFIIRLSDQSITVQRPLRKSVIVAWKQILNISASRAAINIHTVDGKKIAVNRLMDGIAPLLQGMVRNTHPAVSRRITRVMIQFGLLPPHSFDMDGRLVDRAELRTTILQPEDPAGKGSDPTDTTSRQTDGE